MAVAPSAQPPELAGGQLERRPSLEQARALAARLQPDPAALQLHRGLRDAGLRVPEAARARARASRRSCWSPPIRASASGAGRSSAFARARCCAGRWPTAAIRTRSRPSTCAPLRPGADGLAAGRPRSPAAPSASSAMTSCAPSSRSATLRGSADPLGLPDMALMLSDALVVFDHLKHTVTILANADLQAEPDVERAYEQAARTIGEVRCALAGPVPRRVAGGARSGARDAAHSSRTCRASASKRWWRASSSTSTRAMPSRSCPPSAGRRRCRSRHSRSTAGCGRSTRAPTCTSSTSATSRWPARARSRC